MTKRDALPSARLRGSRAMGSNNHDRGADSRDRAADERDLAADSRDRVADERDRVACERESAIASRELVSEEREGLIASILVEAEVRDARSQARDAEANERDIAAEHVAITYGVDYNIDDARPFHARRLARTDRLNAAGDRRASQTDRLALGSKVLRTPPH